MKIQGGLVIATVYAVNNYDRERMKSPMNPVSEEPTSPKQDEVIKEKDKGRPQTFRAKPPRWTWGRPTSDNSVQAKRTH